VARDLRHFLLVLKLLSLQHLKEHSKHEIGILTRSQQSRTWRSRRYLVADLWSIARPPLLEGGGGGGLGVPAGVMHTPVNDA
jgi:hypothetical protein